MNEKAERYLLYSILTIVFIILLYVYFSSQATFDSGDGIQHYLMARYSWKQPMLLLDLWGKPLFTFISSPFAQFGLKGICVFQIICALATSFFCYRIAQRFEIKNNYILPVLICFAPVYFPIVTTGLTEIFFGLIIVVSIYLMVEKKFMLAAVVASFLPFARNEGYLFFPLFIIVFFYRRKYISLFLMGTGTFILSIIGLFVFKNIFWLFKRNPYTGAQDIYGHGELLSFVKQYDQIFGLLISVFILLGLGWIVLKLVSPKKILNPFFTEELFLVYGCAAVYFIGHSIFWWKGMFSSLGMTRMMAAIIPLAALISLRGFNMVCPSFKKYPSIPAFVAILYATGVMTTAFKQWYYPFRFSPEDKIVNAVGKWYKTSEVSKQKIYYLHPFLAHTLNINPFDSTKAALLWGVDKEHPENTVKNNEIVAWDAHYSANEGKMELGTLSNNPNFILLKKFVPEHEFTVIGGRKFEIYFFQRTGLPIIKDSTHTGQFLKYDFEGAGKYDNSFIISSEKSFSGKYSCKISNNMEYGAIIKQPVSDLQSFKDVASLTVNAKLLANIKLKEVLMAVEVRDKNGNALFWKGEEIKNNATGNEDIWQSISSIFNLPGEFMKKENTIVFYIWNKARADFFMDDLKLTYQKSDMHNTVIVSD